MNFPFELEARSEDEYIGNFLLIYDESNEAFDAAQERLWILAQDYGPLIDMESTSKAYFSANAEYSKKFVTVTEFIDKVDVLFNRFESSVYRDSPEFLVLKKTLYDLSSEAEHVRILYYHCLEMEAFVKTRSGYFFFSWQDLA